LLQAEDDNVDNVNQSLVYYIALKNAGVHVEMHLYAQGGHAFGLRPTKWRGGRKWRGEANGGRVIVEVPSPNPIGFLLHESLHVLLAPHLDEIKAAGESAGMRWENLNEGIVYAMAPGLTDNPAEVDALAEQLARFLARGTPASDNYAQTYMIAIVIIPLLRASIDAGETFPLFLPKAVAKWRSFMAR
jgi:hypothetical protein